MDFKGWTPYGFGCLYLEINNKTGEKVLTVEENAIFCEDRGAQMVLLDHKSKSILFFNIFVH